MSNPTDKVFANGLIVKRNENAPAFVTCSLSVKVEEFIAFLSDNESNGWVNLSVKQSQGGKYYAELDTWKPQAQKQEVSEQTTAKSDGDGGDLPF
jgi:hypothetical protein